MTSTLKQRIKLVMTRHRPGEKPNVFIHSMPRSGSTWLMELILTQSGFAAYNEPLNLRKEVVKDNLGVNLWADLHEAGFKEKLGPYFEALCSGSLRDPRFNRPSPLGPFYRPVTDRVVFKIIHGAEEHITWLSKTFNGRVVFLVRHPIPVALSRKYTPKLDTMLETDFARFFSREQLGLAHRIKDSGNQFARNVLDWCLRNSVALRSRSDDWVVLTYEQLVVDPVPAIELVVERLELPNMDRILNRLSVPSKSVGLSNPDTQKVLSDNQNVQEKRWLVEKWVGKTPQEQLALADELVEAFGLSSLYNVSETLPSKSYWI
jgi:hypothetical protein